MKALGIVKKKFPQLVCVGCATHTGDLLNEDVAYTLSSDFTRVRTGSATTRFGFRNADELNSFIGS